MEKPAARGGTEPPASAVRRARHARRAAAASIELSAVIVAASVDEPRVLTILGEGDTLEALPSGPLEAEHRTLEVGLRAWVESQTRQTLGYVEQLYTFGDQNRVDTALGVQGRALTVAYLALVREARSSDAAWRNWYRYFPWEDWRAGKPAILAPLEDGLQHWADAATGEAEQRLRVERLRLAFGTPGTAWNEELVLERYELLYQAGLIAEAWRRRGETACGELPEAGVPMAFDHRRILATAMGRLRGKIKYRPVVFEAMPPSFTLLRLQRTVEALAGVRLHKQNFRRLVEQQGLVEETGEISAETGGRPARLVRFRREVLLERPAPGLRLRAGRRALAL
jgi:hypothetical protein